MKTWLQDAYDAGARILVRTRATKVTQANGAANGVEAQTVDGHRVTVRSKAVVASAGALQTPVLLQRSGLGNKNIGKHLKLHPVMLAWGICDEQVDPGRGCSRATTPTRTPTWTTATGSSTSTPRSSRASCCRSPPGAAPGTTPS